MWSIKRHDRQYQPTPLLPIVDDHHFSVLSLSCSAFLNWKVDSLCERRLLLALSLALPRAFSRFLSLSRVPSCALDLALSLLLAVISTTMLQRLWKIDSLFPIRRKSRAQAPKELHHSTSFSISRFAFLSVYHFVCDCLFIFFWDCVSKLHYYSVCFCSPT